MALRTPISPLFILKQVHSGKKAISPNFHWDVPALLENLSTSQVLLRPVLNTWKLALQWLLRVGGGGSKLLGGLPSPTCEVESANTLSAWGMLWVAGQKESQEGGREGKKVFRLYSSADARRTGASRRAANPRRSFQGIIPCNDTLYVSVWLDMLSSKYQGAVKEIWVQDMTRQVVHSCGFHGQPFPCHSHLCLAVLLCNVTQSSLGPKRRCVSPSVYIRALYTDTQTHTHTNAYK